MGLPTDSYIDVEIDEEVVDRIGLSAPLSDITDISGVCFCGQYNNQLQNPGLYETLIPDSQVVNRLTPLRWDGSGFPIELSYGSDSAYTAPGGMYGCVVWLYYIDGDNGSIPPDYCITANKISKYKLVTEWDAPHYVHYPEDPSKNIGEALYQYRYSSWSDNQTQYGIYDNYYGLNFKRLEYWSDNLKTDYVVIKDIYPYQILEFNGKLYLLAFQYNHSKQGYYDSDSQTNNYNPYNLSYDSSERFASSLAFPHGTFDNGGNISTDNLPYTINSYYHLFVGVSADGNFIGEVETNSSDLPGADGRLEMESWIYFHSRDAVYQYTANSGLKFYTDKLYKPIISGGVVVGFTDDMDEESELDEWTGTTDHGIGPTPPVPPTPSGEDNIDSMGFDGMSCSVGGPAKYYIMSYSDIHHLIGDFNAHAEPGTSISNNIISCYVNALDWNWSTGSEAIEIYSGGAQTVAFTSDVNYDVLTGYNARDIIGSIDVPRMTNTFYDFSPYSTYEVYVPFCGWVALPDTVAGRHIKIYFETDEATCGCKGRVFFVDNSGNGVTVAEITGSFGAPCPIQILEGGLYKQAMLSNGLQVIGGIASGVMGGASGAGVLAVSGLSYAMQGLGNCLVAGNTNYGQTIGRAGDASGLMCAGKPYLKITYPPVDEVVNNNMFAHTVGYLCNTIGQLSKFHGFTVCANPHIHISATSTEKDEIKQLLEQGVILP